MIDREPLPPASCACTCDGCIDAHWDDEPVEDPHGHGRIRALLGAQRRIARSRAAHPTEPPDGEQ